MENKSTFQKGEAIVENHVLYAIGGGLIPVPLLDFAAVTAIQLDMFKQLCNLYGVSYDENSGKHWISALASTSLAQLGSSLIKALPFVGSILGGISMSVTSGASTYAIGQVFLKHLESEGTLINFNAETAKEAYEEAFKKGKDIAESLKKNMDAKKKAHATEEDLAEDVEDANFSDIPETKPKQEAKPKAEAKPKEEEISGEDTFQKLERLASMREKGLITNEEFTALKSKLLGEF